MGRIGIWMEAVRRSTIAAASLIATLAVFGLSPRVPAEAPKPGFAQRARSGVYFNGNRLRFPRDQRPFRSGARLLVPFRLTADLIGAASDRTADGKRVTLKFHRSTVVYDKGHHGFKINGKTRAVDSISQDRNGVLYVPIDLFAAVTHGRFTWVR